MIKYVIFDMGGVVKTAAVKHRLSPTKLTFHRLAKETGADPKKLVAFVSATETKIMNGKLSEKELFLQIKKKFKIKHDIKALKAITDRYFTDLNKLNKDVMKILKSLRKNYVVGLVTDVYPLHLRIIKREGFYRHFDYIANSLEVKQTKAEGKKTFQLILKRMKARPEECVFMDDKKENLVFAKKMGIKTIHFKNAKQLKIDLKKLGITV